MMRAAAVLVLATACTSGGPPAELLFGDALRSDVREGEPSGGPLIVATRVDHADRPATASS